MPPSYVSWTFRSPPYRHFQQSRELFLALRAFLFPSQKHSRFPLSHIRHYPLLQERSLDFARDDDTGIALSKHIRCTPHEITPPYRHFEHSREIFLALRAFLLPSQMDSPSLLSHIGRYTSVPERSLDFARDDVTGIALSKHIRCTLREIDPFPHAVMRGAARNLPCTLFFLAPFTEGFPFSAITHTALYQCARKIPRLRSG